MKLQAIRQARQLARDARLMRIPRRFARDATNNNPNSPNRLSRTDQNRQFGWIAPVLSSLGTTSRWVVSLNPDNQIEIGGAYPLEGVWDDPNMLYNACAIAVQGNTTKVQLAATYATAAVTLNLGSAGTTNAFGAYIKIMNSPLNSKFGTYELQIQNGATVLGYFTVITHSMPIELIVLSIANNVGKANVVANTGIQIVAPYSVTVGAIGNLNANNLLVTDTIYAETLNMRDIGDIVRAIGRGAILV